MCEFAQDSISPETSDHRVSPPDPGNITFPCMDAAYGKA